MPYNRSLSCKECARRPKILDLPINLKNSSARFWEPSSLLAIMGELYPGPSYSE